MRGCFIKISIQLTVILIQVNLIFASQPSKPTGFNVNDFNISEKSNDIRDFIQTKNRQINRLKNEIVNFSQITSFNKNTITSEQKNILGKMKSIKKSIASFFDSFQQYFTFQSDLEFDLSNLVDTFNYTIIDATYAKACYRIAFYWKKCLETIDLVPKADTVNLLVFSEFMDKNIFLELPNLSLIKINQPSNFNMETIKKIEPLAQGKMK